MAARWRSRERGPRRWHDRRAAHHRLPLLRRDAGHSVVCDLGAMPLANALCCPRAGGVEPDLRCSRLMMPWSASAASWCSSRRRWRQTAVLVLPSSPGSPRPGSRMPRLVEPTSHGSHWGRPRSWSRWRRTTATCCSTSPAGIPVSASNPPPTSPPPRWPPACRRSCLSRPAERRPEIVAASGHADLVIANNVLAHVPDVNDFVRRACRPGRAAWDRVDRGAATPAGVDRTNPVRHDLSRASLSLLVVVARQSLCTSRTRCGRCRASFGPWWLTQSSGTRERRARHPEVHQLLERERAWGRPARTGRPLLLVRGRSGRAARVHRDDGPRSRRPASGLPAMELRQRRWFCRTRAGSTVRSSSTSSIGTRTSKDEAVPSGRTHPRQPAGAAARHPSGLPHVVRLEHRIRGHRSAEGVRRGRREVHRADSSIRMSR